MTDNNKTSGWVLFDADCDFCRTLARQWSPLLRRYRFDLLPLQTPWVRERLGVTEDELLREMRLLTPPGAVYGGADALLEIARVIWWARPIYWLSRILSVASALRKAYRWTAQCRHCLSGSCRIAYRAQEITAAGDDVRSLKLPAQSASEHEIRDSSSRLLRRIAILKESMRWVPAVLSPILAVTLCRTLPGWIWMWLIAPALFLAAKWLTISRMLFAKEGVHPRRLLAYTLLWPGMDAWAFCGKRFVPAPRLREWVVAAAKSVFGAALVWGGVPLVNSTYPLTAGWVGMVGLVLLLHFGLFHLVSLLWRAVGIDAKPIMQSPLRATSLGKFWGGSWNTAFSDLMRDHLVKPLARHLGARGALLTIFLISGALHELVLSLPARGGYGLPTIYFVLQCLGLLFERSKIGRRIGLGSGWRGWCFVALISGAPAFCLFHPPFVHNVILPMLRAMGAT